MHRVHRDQRGQSLVIVLSLITILFLLGSSLAVHASVALRATRTTAGQGNDFYAADAATELGIWWQRNGKAGNPPAQTINGITTSTTITSVGGGSGSCPADAKPMWLSGFESGQLSTNNGGFYIISSSTYGVIDTVTSPVRTGSYAMRIHPILNAADYAQVQPPLGSSQLGPNYVLHFALRFDVLPTQDAVMLEIRSGCGPCGTYPQMFLWYHAATGKWAVSMGSTATGLYQKYQDGAAGPVAGQWNTFDIRWNAGASPPTPRAIDWQVDGTAQTTLSFLDAAATAASGGPAFGQDDLYTNAQYTAYYDDVVISSTAADYPLGDVRITPLKPNAIHADPLGYLTNFQDDDSTAVDAASYTRVDETPLTGTTDWIKQITSSAGGYVGIDFQDTTQTCIRGASVVAEMRAQSGAPNAAIGTNMSGPATGANNTVWSGSLSTTVSYAQGVLTTVCCPSNPGVGPWTQAGVNAAWALFGYCTNTTSTRRPELHSIILELAYLSLTGGPATITIVGTGGGSTVSTSYTDAGAGVPTLSTWTTTK
jgi:hypothetical protein